MWYKTPPVSKIDDISEFKITKISGAGKVYADKAPFQLDTTNTTGKPVDIRHMSYLENIYLVTDAYTSFEFYCFDIVFTVRPGSALFYKPNSKGLYFYAGEIFWHKVVKENRLNVSIRENENLLTLSDEGRIRIKTDTIEIWNYNGNLKFNFAGQENELHAKQMLLVAPPARPSAQQPTETLTVFDIPSAPHDIDPLEKTIQLDEDPNDSVQQFNWGVVRGTPSYIFRLYSSSVKENILEERMVTSSNVTLDLLQFEERDFYWQVFPIDSQIQKEGVPSELGHVKMIGSLPTRKNVKRPPVLSITSFSINGNTLVVSGSAEANCRLYIDDEQVLIDRDGGFTHVKDYKTLGPQKVIIKLVSPLGVETIQERTFTVFDGVD